MSNIEYEVGQEVVVWHAGHSRSLHIAKIEKVTATQVSVEGQRYIKRTGFMVGSSDDWHPAYIQPYDEKSKEFIDNVMKELALKKRVATLINCLRNIAVSSENVDAVEKFLDSMKEQTK